MPTSPQIAGIYQLRLRYPNSDVSRIVYCGKDAHIGSRPNAHARMDSSDNTRDLVKDAMNRGIKKKQDNPYDKLVTV